MFPSFSNKTKKETTSEFMRYRSSYETMNSGSWNVSQVFVDNGGDVTYSGLNKAYITSQSEYVEDNEVVLMNTLTLETGSNTSPILYGAFSYVIDISSLMLDGLSYDLNSSDNYIEIIDEDWNTAARISMGDILSYNYYTENNITITPGEQTFIWYFDDTNNQIIIFNGENISVYQEYNKSFEVVLDLSYDFYNANPIQLKSFLTFADDTVLEGDEIYSQIIFGEAAADPVVVENLTKSSEVYNSWNDSWGNGGNDDMFFVKYDLGFDLTMDDTYDTLASLTLGDGTLMAYGDGIDYELGGLDDYINSSYATLTSGNNHLTYIVGYEKPASSGSVTKNFSVDLMATGVYSETVDWEVTFDYQEEAVYATSNSNEIDLNINNDSYGFGAINKINNNQDVNFVYTVESIAGDINNSYDGTLLKGFNNWYASNYGENDYTASLEVSNVYLTDTYGTGGTENKLGNNDYAITAIKIKDDKEYDYALDSTNVLYYLTDANITGYGSKKIYGKLANSNEWTLLGTYMKNGSGEIDYIPVDNTTNYSNGVITLPSNTLQVKVEYVGKRAAVYVGYDVYVSLLHSANVKAIVNTNDNVYLKVNAESKDDEADNYHKLTKLSTNSSLILTSNNEGLEGTNNVISYHADFSKSMSYQAGESNLATSLLAKEEVAELYLLLPQGAVLSGTPTVQGYGDVTVTSSKTETAKYNNTNRTLVKLNISNGEGNYLDSNNKITTGYKIDFVINYSQVANRDYGNTLYLDAMYVSGNTIEDGYASASELPSGILTSEDVKATFNLINSGDIKNKLYKGNTTSVNSVTIVAGQAESYVQSVGMNDFATEATIKEGYSYVYKLEYSYSDPLLSFNNVVFYDVLDSAYGSNEYVKGTFDSVDTSYLNDTLGIRTTVYYSTKTDINLSTDTDLTNQNIWSVDLPTDKTKVTAVAVDLGSKVFSGQDRIIPMIYINMIGSNNYTKENLYAYNNYLFKYDDYYDGTSKSSTSATTRVKLEKASVDLALNVKQDINGATLATGTEGAPSKVESNYGYLYTITNSDTLNDYHNININSVVSEGITIDFDNISYYDVLANNKLISEDDRVGYSYDAPNKSINLTVSSLPKNSVINIWVPVIVDMESLTSDDAVITNQAMINRLEGIAYRGTTSNAYNTVAIPQLESTKFIKSGDVYVTTNQEALKVSKGTTYTYMVKVENNSDVVASNILVVDNVPNGLNVNSGSISNDGVYNGGTITWAIDTLGARDSVELTYRLTLPTNIPNNTRYSSNAHVTVVNPFNNSSNIYDEDTNTISVIYNSAADILVNNKVAGTIINNDKEFTYTVTINGNSYDTGQYSITDGNNNELAKINVDSNGVGTKTLTLKNGEKFKVRDLPADVNYTVAINNESGYTTLEQNHVLTLADNKNSLSGTTSDGATDTYTFTSTYYAEGYYDPIAKMTYDGTYNPDDFRFKVNGNDYFSNASNDANDEIHFSQIRFINKIGTFEYTVSQLDLGNPNVIYDDNYYKMYVTVTDNGDGTLSTSATYRDKYDNEATEMVFNNQEVPSGLLIRNVYVGDYIVEDKTFDYVIEVNAPVDGEYRVTNKDKEEVGTLDVQGGTGSYTATLGASEYILIRDLPENTEYVVKMKLEDYYESDATGGSEVNGELVVSGTMATANSEVVYQSSYSTSANYKPVVNIVLNEKELQDSEFTFNLVDISETANGYSDTATNNVDGVIEFGNIAFNKPGTYKYEIRQVKGDSNKILYDENPVILTLVLTDNGDNTMNVQETYTFVEGRTAFINTYSPNGFNNNENNQNNNNNNGSGLVNPNTMDYFAATVIVLLLALATIITVRVMRFKKYAK